VGKMINSNMTVRTVTGSDSKPQLYLTKELKKLGLKKGDHVVVLVDGKRIIIQRAKIDVEVNEVGVD